jgi:SAM-dependent methyltransferase
VSFTERFSERAGAYVAARPSYPVESVDVLIDGLADPASLVVADLGAGTGISSRVIAARGPLVYAVEPNAKMREAAAADPRVRWVDGTAESTTLAAASVDVVAAFQAWHWVDHPAGIAEARRILRPGGRMAAIYNERDERDPFTAGYGEIVMRYSTDATEQHRFDALAAFAAIDPLRTQRFEFVNVHQLDRAGLHQRADSSSYLPHTGEDAEAMHAEIDELFTEWERDGFVNMHLVTLVVRVDA